VFSLPQVESWDSRKLYLNRVASRGGYEERLFVNGLPFHVTAEILENFFLAYGAAFVEMSSELEAEITIQNLDGTEVEGGH